MNEKEIMPELEQLTSQDIPDLDLYMDQVIQLFASCYQQQAPDDKGLTKTMINNYAKGKLFPPVKNKKYNKTQIMFLNLIFQLKGTISLTEIKTLLAPLNEKVQIASEDETDFFTLYDQMTTVTTWQHQEFATYLQEQAKQVSEYAPAQTRYEEKLTQIVMLAHLSNVSRTLAQQFIQELANEAQTATDE
ncbi:MAG: DUF1836 domain-containing protein [Culicoidibacterales bacterium]